MSRSSFFCAEYKSTPSLEGKVRMIVHPLQSLSHDLNPEIIVALAYITDDYREHIANGVAINSRHILISADSVEDHLDIPNLNGIGAIIMNIFYYAINLRVPTKKSKEPDSKYNDIGLMTVSRLKLFKPRYKNTSFLNFFTFKKSIFSIIFWFLIQ